MHDLLVTVYNCTLTHEYNPQNMLVGTFIPIPKIKELILPFQITSECLQSVLCKLMDTIILFREAGILITSESQFGFKEGLSASLVTSMFLEPTDYYVHKEGIYALALDASKAFDRVRNDKLFN